MKCKNCGRDMRLDDVDYNFKGNKDNYWICDYCFLSAVERVRFNKTVSVDYFICEVIEEENDVGRY